jgi:hypothetical protein
MKPDFTEPVILDDVLPEQLASDIEQVFFSNQFPWYFLNDIALPSNFIKEDGYVNGFTHLLYNKDQVTSNAFALIKEVPTYAMHKAGIYNPYYLYQARGFLQVVPGNNTINGIHVDLFEEHTVFIYYINYSDGDTVLFGKTPNPTIEDITFRSTPKRNRLLMFDGSTWHASSNATKGKRAIINFNLKF